MTNQLQGHFTAFVVFALVLTVYDFYLPTNANGTYLSLSNMLAQLGISLPTPFGNWGIAALFGVLLAGATIYGILLILTLVQKRGKSRGLLGSGVLDFLFGWLLTTIGVIISFYIVFPAFGVNAIAGMVWFFNGINQILQLTGASWLTFQANPPPSFGITLLIYWATFTLFVIGLWEAARLIFDGAIYRTRKGRGG